MSLWLKWVYEWAVQLLNRICYYECFYHLINHEGLERINTVSTKKKHSYQVFMYQLPGSRQDRENMHYSAGEETCTSSDKLKTEWFLVNITQNSSK